MKTANKRIEKVTSRGSDRVAVIDRKVTYNNSKKNKKHLFCFLFFYFFELSFIDCPIK
jgi:hypothetical protein